MPDGIELPTPLTPQQSAKRAELMAGVFKQLLTLNTAAIGFLAFFMDKLQPAGDGLAATLANFALLLAPIAFLASLLGAFFTLVLLTMASDPTTGEKPTDGLGVRVSFGVALLGFPLGVLCLALPPWLSLVARLLGH